MLICFFKYSEKIGFLVKWKAFSHRVRNTITSHLRCQETNQCQAVCQGKSICLDFCPLPSVAKKPHYVCGNPFFYVQLSYWFCTRMELILKYRDSATTLHFSVDRTRKCKNKNVEKNKNTGKHTSFDNIFRRFRNNGGFS